MATKSPPRKSAPKKSAKSSAKGKPAAKRTSKPASTPRRKAPAPEPTFADSSFARLISRYAADIWGVFFVAAGLVCALAIYLGAAGPVGAAIDAGFGRLFGLFRVLVPPAFLALGFVLILGPRERARTTPNEDARDEAVRLSVGGLCLAVAGTGLLHVMRGRPSLGDPTEEFARAGGFIGWLSGAPLGAALGAFAASLVLIAIALVGVVLITQVSLRRWVDRSATFIEPVRGAGSSLWRGLLGSAAAAPATVGPELDIEADPMDLDPNDLGAPQVVVSGMHDVDFAEESELGEAALVGDSEVDPNLLPEDLFGSGDPLLDRNTAVFDWPEPVDEAVPAPEPEPVPQQLQVETPTVVVARPEPVTEKSAADLAPRRRKGSKWKLPSLSLLESSAAQDVDSSLVEEAGRTLERALAAHGVETRLVGMVVGPTVTRYELELGEGVKVARVTNLSKDIAYAMASPDVRILAPIPGRQAIGVEVPNQERQVVALGDLLRSKEARKLKDPLAVPLGRDINGKAKMMDLAKMPHVLIAGATGSGKSSCINTIITSVLMRATPDDVRMILVDPKMVEMTQYERVPHLLTQPVTDPKKAANALAWACREMDRRYELLSSVGYRDIGGYNKAFDDKKLPESDPTDPNAKEYPRLPLILVVVDELADLMMVAARDVEDSILRIAQKARAIGIHLVIATQRPSTNVITGVIKANIPAKIAFSVSNMTDSRVILDQPGAERLIGKGDMLMLSPTSSAPDRIQGCWVDEDEVKVVVGEWRSQEVEPIASSGAPDAAPGQITSESVAPQGAQLSMLSSDADLAAAGVDSAPAPFAPDVQATSADASVAPEPLAAPVAQAAPAGPTDELDPITSTPAAIGGANSDDDELLPQAIELVVTSQLGSTSMLQRKLRVGFARAGRIMDELEEKGVVGPSVGSKAREVLITPEQLPQLLGS